MKTIHSDVLIIGGGVAGLWLHHRLNDLGYKAILVEKSSLGGSQTLSSQGIIHGGAKYTLGGIFSDAASAISEMPERWLKCLEGNGDIDLRKTKVLSQNQLMWSSQSLSSKLTSFFSSKVLRGKVTRLPQSQYPDFFNNEKFDGNLYQLNEPVLDVPSLVKNLAEKWHSRILCSVKELALIKDECGKVTAAVLGDEKVKITSDQFILAAGEGNEAVLENLSLKTPEMQRRPLKMVLVKGAALIDLYAHCIGSSNKPIATITTHRHPDGENLWYVGGNIAEQGVPLNDENLIKNTQATLCKILPWADFQKLKWSTHSVNRAEPAQNSLLRPDTSFLDSISNIHICWPTKLALTPNLADKILEVICNSKMQTGLTEASNLSFDKELQLLKTEYRLSISSSLWERKF